jgi:hypothetical protein
VLQLAAEPACSLACTTEVVALLLMLVHQLAKQLLLANQHLYASQLLYANQIHVVAANQVFWLVFAPRWLLRRAAVLLLLAKPLANQPANQLQFANQLQQLAAKQLQFANQLAHQAARRACWLA